MKKKTLLKLISGLISLFLLVHCTKNGSPSSDSGISSFKATSLTQVSGFGSNPGSLAMYKYVPSGLPNNAPLVVALHGCSQDAQTYANDTMWAALADQYKFSVVFPQTSSSNNSLRCFNWFETGDMARGSGEALSIKQMIDKMVTDHSADTSRIYITGLSAGAYMVVVMASVYPEVFSGAAPMAGGPYKCGVGVSAAFSCMSPGVDKTGEQWASLVRSGYSGYTGKYPKMSIWAGTSDTTVKPINSAELMQGWTSLLGLSESPTFSETIQGNPHKVWKNNAGETLVELWEITGMSHGITVDPDGTNGKAGGAKNTYAFDKNVWSSYEAAKFFGLDNSDNIAPQVSITSPANGTDVSGNIMITTVSSDNVGVTKVEIYIDGILKSTSSSFNWDSSQSTNGLHNISAKAFDAAGNIGTALITVNVSGGIIDTEAPVVSITSPQNGTSLSGIVTVSTLATDNFGVTRVEFYVDDILKGTVSVSPYNYPIDVSTLTDGTHVLKVKAFDAAGNIGSTQINIITSQLVYSEAISATSTAHYNTGRINVTQYIDLGNGTNSSGINPGKIKYGFITAFYLYKLKSNGTWVTEQSIPVSQKK